MSNSQRSRRIHNNIYLGYKVQTVANNGNGKYCNKGGPAKGSTTVVAAIKKTVSTTFKQWDYKRSQRIGFRSNKKKKRETSKTNLRT